MEQCVSDLSSLDSLNQVTTDDQVLELTDGKAADIIFDQGGPATSAQSFTYIKWDGLISCVGVVNTNVLVLRRNVTLKGIWSAPGDWLEEAHELYGSDECIRPVVDTVFGFNEAKEAFEYVSMGSHFCKVLINVKV